MMRLIRLDELVEGEEWIGLGVAGNQAGHLNQAGEATDFKYIEALENAPKGMFPWFISSEKSAIRLNPVSTDRLQIRGEERAQPEPEIALVVSLEYNEDLSSADGISSRSGSPLIESLTVKGFTAFNDLSRRIQASKISHKKNWGEGTHGMAEWFCPIDDFLCSSGELNHYRLVCFLKREGVVHAYGEDTAVNEYCYFNDVLSEWIVNQLNTQQDQGPLEALSDMISVNKPTHAVIGIGATRYTEFGNSDERFLKGGDHVYVIAYDGRLYSPVDIQSIVSGSEERACEEGLLILSQGVC